MGLVARWFVDGSWLLGCSMGLGGVSQQKWVAQLVGLTVGLGL